MDNYREYVNAVARAADGKETILNKTTGHASVLMETLFRKAQNHVRILSGELDDRAYGTADVIAAARLFLTRPDTHLSIIIERPVKFAASKFLSALRADGSLTSDDMSRVKLLMSGAPHPFHFALADDHHYRFEADTQLHEAIAKFGVRTEDTAKLRNAFEVISKGAERFFPQE